MITSPKKALRSWRATARAINSGKQRFGSEIADSASGVRTQGSLARQRLHDHALLDAIKEAARGARLLPGLRPFPYLTTPQGARRTP